MGDSAQIAQPAIYDLHNCLPVGNRSGGRDVRRDIPVPVSFASAKSKQTRSFGGGFVRLTPCRPRSAEEHAPVDWAEEFDKDDQPESDIDGRLQPLAAG